MKTFFFDSGLPRSGSTLLTAILNQNPQIHAGPLSPVFETMYCIQNYFHNSEQVKAYPKPDCNFKIISSVIENYYSDVTNSYIIDKSRAWPGHMDFIQKYITPNPKIICTIRNPLDILASFINLIHQHSNQISFIDRYLIKNNFELNDNNRCDFLMSPKGIIFNSLNEIAKAFHEKNQKYIHFIEYDILVDSPKKVMIEIYNFLELDFYEHRFTNITNQYREEDKKVYGLDTMHEIRPNIEKNVRDYKEVLSPYVINKYKNLNFWNQ